MKRIRLLGLALIAVFALGAFASASAFAENPEILPVPTKEKPAEFKATSNGETILETSGKVKVVCKKAKGDGSFTDQDKGTGKIDFEECKSEGLNCNSPGDAAGVILIAGKIELVDVLPESKLLLGLLLTPTNAAGTGMVEFTCGGLIKAKILGAVIGLVDNKTGADLKDLEKFLEIKVLWKQAGGAGSDQAIRTCDLLKATCEGMTFELLSEIFGKHELSAQIADATLTFTKEWEVHF